MPSLPLYPLIAGFLLLSFIWLKYVKVIREKINSSVIMLTVCVCVWWVGMEGWDNGLLKNAKNVNEINDEIKGLKNNFWTLNVRVYDTIFFSYNFFYRSETWSLLLAEKCKFLSKPEVRDTLKTEMWRLETFTPLYRKKYCKLCRSFPTILSF